MKIKEIEGFKGYSIREDGVVISHPKKMGRGKGYFKPEAIMIPKLDKYGYHVIGLRKDGNKYFFGVHRLIAKAFITNPNNKPTVDHVNRNKLDNRIENLRWATISEQNNNRNIAKGIRNAASKLTESDVVEIRESELNGVELSVKYGVHRNTIYKVKSNKTWK